MGLGDHRGHDRRPDLPRAADGPADPLDAGAPGARAGDEGDPAEVQGRPAEAERRADEVLQGEQHQPGRVVPADAGAAAGLLLALPDAAARGEAHHRHVARDRAISTRTSLEHWSGYVLLAIYAGSQVASTYFMGAQMDKTQRTIMMILPLIFLTVVVALPDRPRPLLDDDEPVDGRPGPDHAAADAEAAAPRCPAPARGAARARRRLPHRRSSRRTAAPSRPSQRRRPGPRRVKRKKGGARR